MTSFLELFEPIQKGNFGLTDQAIYGSIQRGGEFIPIWGGNQEHTTIDRLVSVNGRTKSGELITVFEGEGIIISLDGSAGSMTFKQNQKFALNHHAGFFKLKKEAGGILITEFFALFYQHQLKEASISEGSKTLTLDQIYSMDFDIPSYEVQQRIMKKINPLLEKRRQIAIINSKIDSLFAKTIVE